MNLLVTGGSSGLGKVIVEKLASDSNNTIYFTFNSHSEVAISMTNMYPNVIAWKCNFTDRTDLNNLCNIISDWELDVLINNAYAGKAQGIHFHKHSENDFLNSFEMNVLPVISITQKVLETFCRKKSGKIINILTTSIFNQPPIGYAIYAANKAYIHQLSKSWSKEYQKYGITSNCVSPDYMQTELTSDTDPRIVEQIRLGHPLKKLLTPDEVANCILFLVNTSSQLNGVNIPINAGKSIL